MTGQSNGSHSGSPVLDNHIITYHIDITIYKFYTKKCRVIIVPFLFRSRKKIDLREDFEEQGSINRSGSSAFSGVNRSAPTEIMMGHHRSKCFTGSS